MSRFMGTHTRRKINYTQGKPWKRAHPPLRREQIPGKTTRKLRVERHGKGDARIYQKMRPMSAKQADKSKTNSASCNHRHGYGSERENRHGYFRPIAKNDKRK